MNIYITEDNEEKLRHYDGSMSGLVNRLLATFWERNPSAATGGLKPAEDAAKAPAPVPLQVNPKSHAPAVTPAQPLPEGMHTTTPGGEHPDRERLEKYFKKKPPTAEGPHYEPVDDLP